MKKLTILLTSFTLLSLPAFSIVSCDNFQTKDKNSSQLLKNTSKTQTKASIANDEVINEKDNLKTSANDVENKKTDIPTKSFDNETDEFDAFKKPKNEFNDEEVKNNKTNSSNNHKTTNNEKINNVSSEKNSLGIDEANTVNNKNDSSNNHKTVNNESSTNSQITNTNNAIKNNHNLDQKNVKAKTWVEKLGDEDPQYLKLINFIEMISNSTKQLLVDEKYNRLPKYKQLTKVKFWDFFWKSFKTELLKAKATNKKLYNEIFDDAILQTNSSNTNECTYILKSNNFVSFTFGYDRRDLNFYFASEHPKYGKIDSKFENIIFKKKYEPVYCTITSEDNVDLF